ncbi:hypothetical protein PsYK624_004790 [Phanerochaete sordida]|uniref:Uncharacterized protein n=1 Tax=Phanerochaete sordida TaxID=48140 RepID=A0A9P3L7X1_9APHY|nr:hypothetical protein PsYK624_004790 [Phanerochaete sordida]
MTLALLRLPVLSWLLVLRLATAAVTNITVDDSDASIVYSPPGVWWTNSTELDSAPNASLALNGTWHFGPNTPASKRSNDADNASITFVFTGTSVNVFTIQQRQVLTAIDIFINGTIASNFSQVVDLDAPFMYNFSIFSSDSLPLGEHTLVLAPSSQESSWVCLDYIVYGQELLASSPPSGQLNPGKFQAPPPQPTATSPDNPQAVPPESSPGNPGGFGPKMLATSGPTTEPSQLTESPSPLTVVKSKSTASTTSSSTQGTATSVAGAVSSTSSPPHNLAIIIGPAVAGALFLFFLLLGCCLWRRRHLRATRALRVDPFPSPDPSPNTQTEFMKALNTPRSPHPFLARLSFQTLAESVGASTMTLTDEIFPVPAEVDDVYNQLEALSAEVRQLQRAEQQVEQQAAQQAGRETAYTQLPPRQRVSGRRTTSRTVQAGIEQLRADVQRLRRRSGTSSGAHGSGQHTGGAEPSEMLQNLVFLRAEIDELLREVNQNSESTEGCERLPSYHSRRAVHGVDSESPPPMPPQTLNKSYK